MSQGKKLVTVSVPVYNEENMISELCDRVEAVFRELDQYDYEIVFFDDGSTDGTGAAIEKLCGERAKVKCVRYTRNFGYLKSTFYCMQQAKGDCAILLHADLQNPPELIPQFLEKWESGAAVVQGVKSKSRENRFVFFLRSVFYFIMIHLFGVNMKAHATEFELFDRSFIEVLRRIKVNEPFLRGIVAEYAPAVAYVYYTQDARKCGRSKFNLKKYYEFAICGITQYSRILPRRVIAVSVVLMLGQIIEFFAVFLPHSMQLRAVELSNSILLRIAFFVLCLLIILICVIFEHVVAVLNHSVEKPLVIEKKRINY